MTFCLIVGEVSFPWSDSSTATLMFHSDRGSFVHRGFHVDFEQVLCRRQGRQNRDELDQSVVPQNSTVRSASSSTSEWTSSLSSFDADWDDSKTTPRNSSVEYAA
ncbi:hypothetical protein AVEN_84245-1 [Araneus ventricosus]|uniref:Uncharacterized protein n=1 Tax=Araneus ventricosus TaxID=182803 RepID=A0A4Y2L1M2_ARAVE|nr:hypothetical protein AVEN_84245-1 [Araneus ventricosus]